MNKIKFKKDRYDSITNYTYDINERLLRDRRDKKTYRYAGYRYDEETGIYYLNARYYDPKIARFLTEDTYRGNPNDPLSLNLYTYCANEPMMYWDPTRYRVETSIVKG